MTRPPPSSRRNARKLDHAVDVTNDRRFEYFGLRTVYDRYLLRHPDTRMVIETPQYFLLRVACGLSHTPQEAIAFYRLMASLAYLPSSPTLFNSGTRHTQMSSCYLVDSPQDDARVDLRPLRAGRQALEVRWWHWDLVVAGAVARGAHPRHQRPLQRHRPVAAHPRLVGVGGQPGWPPQGCRLRLPRAVAPRHRGVPRAARQHRRGRPSHPQPQPRQLGPRRVHAPRRGRRAVEPHRPERGARAARPLGAGLRGRRMPRRSATGATCARSVPASSTAR